MFFVIKIELNKTAVFRLYKNKRILQQNKQMAFVIKIELNQQLYN